MLLKLKKIKKKNLQCQHHLMDVESVNKKLDTILIFLTKN